MKQFISDLAVVGSPQQAGVIGAGGLLGAILTHSLGGWSGMIEVLLWAMALDFVSGIAASIKEKTGLKSRLGLTGILKKILILAAVAFGHQIDVAFGLDYARNGLLIAFLINEMISLSENYGRLDLPLSQYLQPFITILKNKGGNNNGQ